MRRLRQKVEVDPNKPAHLLTVRGIGYRLVSAGSLAT
jgi:DNA-binding response OmpR family regulator